MDYQIARNNMVENQIRPNHVTDAAVIAAMTIIPREKFVPEDVACIAYVDEAIATVEGRYLMAPMVLARLLEEAKVSQNDIVMNIGCGVGYELAILAQIAKVVVGIEANKILADKASSNMTELGIDNTFIVHAALAKGYAKQAPYDVILFNGAIDEVPKSILDQLVDGGRVVSIVPRADALYGSMGKAVVLERFGNIFSSIEVFDASAPVIPDFVKEKTFEF
jgi:protein-L-isoaspartate(D-aspartate) O-methyltransferase